MSTQFILNDKGERAAAIIPISEYEDFLHRSHLKLELIEDYKRMIDTMLEQEFEKTAQYVTFDDIKRRFSR